MGTFSSELGPLVERTNGRPRVYADANIPTGVVTFMRKTLEWDVLFVLEHDELRRARDIEHYRLARQLGRTLITLDRDYLDDRGFPPGEGDGSTALSCGRRASASARTAQASVAHRQRGPERC